MECYRHIYFCAFSCVAGVLYINSLKDSIKSQRENIQRNDKVLEFTNELISEVNEAQSAANLFTITDNKQHLEDFNQSIEKLKALMIQSNIITTTVL